MYWQKRLDQEDPDVSDLQEILEIRQAHKDYGYRRICAELRRRGRIFNKKKIQRLSQKFGLQVSSYGRKSRKYNSYRGTVGLVAPNRLQRRFHTEVPYQKITTDTTELKYYVQDPKGRLQIQKAYLDPYMDLYNREILTYRLTRQPNGTSILEGLEEAIQKTEGCRFRRTFHSDQGWAYQMKSYRKRLQSHGIYQSMSRKGNCLDNSPMENFFGIM